MGTLAEKALKLPETPGVYIMLDAAGQVIYVGKAKKLKNRVSSYFRGSHNTKTEAMISKIADFNVIMVNTEFEALMLEDSLIKHHMPKYNILLKDDKGYPYIRLDVTEPYPTFSVVSHKGNDGALYFGPFGGRQASFDAIDAIRKALKLPGCSKKFPRDIGKERPCLNYHIGACRAYCLRDTGKELHDKAISEAILVLDGKTDKLLQQLKEEMETAAGKLRFEEAAEIRDRMKAIERLETRQYAVSQAFADTDAVGLFTNEVRSCFAVLHYVDGNLLNKDVEFFDSIAGDPNEAISGFLRQYYLSRRVAPKTVCVPVKLPDKEELEKFVEEKIGIKVRFIVPQSGSRLKFVRTAELNAREETARITTREERISKTAQWLMNALKLDKIPDRIEAYDISNMGSSDIVASMTVFSEGKPLKRAYRKFKMKTVDGQNDYGSMAEVITRRLQRYLDGDEKFAPLPDIMLIDGGSAHANAALNAAHGLGIDLPVFGMVKDDRHRTRALISPDGEEIGIAAQPSVFAFIGTIQEETHRFAITYHKNLHTRNTLTSELDSIKGVGDKRKEALLKEWGSVKKIAAATEEELRKVVPANTAKAVYEHFNSIAKEKKQK